MGEGLLARQMAVLIGFIHILTLPIYLQGGVGHLNGFSVQMDAVDQAPRGQAKLRLGGKDDLALGATVGEVLVCLADFGHW